MKPVLVQLKDYRTTMLASYDSAEITKTLSLSDDLYN